MNEEILIRELQFKALRSSGAGGQHVNKVSSKIELTFNLEESMALSETEKLRLLEKLSRKLTKEGALVLYCSESRSQHKNKALAIEKLLLLLKSNLKTQKPRKKTKPGKGAIEKRLEGKRKTALKKANRKPPSL
jgi:ribosome-associated protein